MQNIKYIKISFMRSSSLNKKDVVKTWKFCMLYQVQDDFCGIQFGMQNKKNLPPSAW